MTESRIALHVLSLDTSSRDEKALYASEMKHNATIVSFTRSTSPEERVRLFIEENTFPIALMMESASFSGRTGSLSAAQYARNYKSQHHTQNQHSP